MKLISVKLKESKIWALDQLIRDGKYLSRSEIIRTAIRDLLKKELNGRWNVSEAKPSVEIVYFSDNEEAFIG